MRRRGSSAETQKERAMTSNAHASKAFILNPTPFGWLMDYRANWELRPATVEELLESIEAAKRDGGAGVIMVDGRACYVDGFSGDLP